MWSSLLHDKEDVKTVRDQQISFNRLQLLLNGVMTGSSATCAYHAEIAELELTLRSKLLCETAFRPSKTCEV